MKNLFHWVGAISVLAIITSGCVKLEVNHRCCNSEYEITTQNFAKPDSFELYIPQAFTPNNDGVNDVYKIQNNGVDIINFELMIYNRLGQLVYSSNNINNSWDGMFKGNKLLPQVFDFYLEMEIRPMDAQYY